MKRIMSIAIYLFSAFLLCGLITVKTPAAPGDLDLTFSGDGKLTDIIPGAGWNSFVATAVQPDGKIVAVGGVGKPRYIYVARYNPDGSPDTTFGGGTGKVAVQFGGFYNYVADVALQPDGKILIAGCYCEEDFGDYTLALARLNSDGSLDASFGFNGVVLRPDIIWSANSVAVQADGKIVAATSNEAASAFVIARFNTDGSSDMSFGVGGQVATTGLGTPYAVAIQANGKIVAAGSSVYTGALSDFAVVRYNPNGSLDTTFDGDGIVTTPIGPGWDEAYSVAIQTDGKIVAAGGSDWQSPNNDFAVVRYNDNGSLDTTFDGDGIVTTAIGPAGDGANSVKIQSDGKIVVAGSSHNGSNNDFALVRYNPNGSLDATFGGGDGKTTVDFDNSNDGGFGMALDNVGRAVVVGGSGVRFAIARFLLATNRAIADFDGDGRSDISVFRPSDRVWYLNQSTAGYSATQFGLSTDKITPADFDGDGKTDISVYRDGTWYWLKSSDNSFNARQFGIASDSPVPVDYTGDGRAELAVYRGGVWWTLNLNNEQANASQFGVSTDRPVPADYDGDGRIDQAVYRNGEWHLNRSSQGYTVVNFGLATDKPVIGDYDGDGRADQAVYRDGTWYLLQSSQGFATFPFGIATDIPAPADYDGDGKTDAAVYRDGVWYLRQSTSGISIQQFGLTGDKPVPSAYLPQ